MTLEELAEDFEERGYDIDEDELVAGAGAQDVALLCPDAVAVVGPARKVEGEPFSCAAAWWPPRAAGGAAGAGSVVLYTIEAHWDAHGALDQVRYLVFEHEVA